MRAIVPGARPRPSRRALIVSGAVGGIAGLVAAVIVNVLRGADLWVYLGLIVAGAFLGATIWDSVPVLSKS
jgi:hypothetical protein